MLCFHHDYGKTRLIDSGSVNKHETASAFIDRHWQRLFIHVQVI